MKNRQAGHSLIEIAIAIAIVGFLLTATVSAFGNYSANGVIRDVAEEMNQGLRQARVEAITRNQQVQFVTNGSGWTIQLPAVPPAPATVLATRPVRSSENSLLITPNPVTVTFTGAGIVTPTPLATIQISISNPGRGTCVAVGGNIRCLQVEVFSGGKTKSCDPSLPASDPRSC